MISKRNLERLIQYRRTLLALQEKGADSIFSHELAHCSGFSSAQIRRDLMAIGYSGSPAHGYNKRELLKSLNEFLDTEEIENVAVIGAGHIGRALLHYFQGRRPKLQISAVFDVDPEKLDRIMYGSHTYHIDQLSAICKEQNIHVGILAVPASVAQETAQKMVDAGIHGILNYAPVDLVLPEGVYIENRDMILAVEKITYISRQLNKH